MRPRPAAVLMGPSLAKEPRRFREIFGSDDELLRLTDEKLAALRRWNIIHK